MTLHGVVSPEYHGDVQEEKGVPLVAGDEAQPHQTASEQRWNNLKGFKGFYLKAKVRIWP